MISTLISRHDEVTELLQRWSQIAHRNYELTLRVLAPNERVQMRALPRIMPTNRQQPWLELKRIYDY